MSGSLRSVDPVDLHGARDVADVVEEHVLVRLDDPHVLGVIQVLRDPLVETSASGRA